MPITTPLLRMSELDAINRILVSTGHTPVSSIVDTGNADVEQARDTLHATSREVQEQGWHWNTQLNYRLQPDVNSRIILPSNTLRVDSLYGINVFERDGYLRKAERVVGENPDEFTDDIYVDLVEFLAFTVIPSAARWYITVKAARRFGDSNTRSSVVSRFTQNDELEALAKLQEADNENADFNIITGTQSRYNIVWRSPGAF